MAESTDTECPHGKKFDSGKVRWSLLPWKQLEEVAKVMTAGAVKYGDYNWKFVEQSRDRYFSATMRHLTEWKSGRTLDQETSLHHLSHAVCCLLFLQWHDEQLTNLLKEMGARPNE